jgi:hypothetical protein
VRDRWVPGPARFVRLWARRAMGLKIPRYTHTSCFQWILCVLIAWHASSSAGPEPHARISAG